MPTQLDLAPRHVAMLRRLLDEHVPAAEVWAFGSRVTGRAHEGSDLDMVLRNPQHLAQPCAGQAELVDALADSMLPMLVDVHDWASLPPAWHAEIARRHLLLKPAAIVATPAAPAPT